MDGVYRFWAPDVQRHLLQREGEIILDEVHKHWAVILPWAALACCAMPLFILMIPFKGFFWLPLIAGLVVFARGMLGVHAQHMDRFVITNMRVFRVHGIFNQHLATVPLSRILDISLSQPFLGQLLGYGHFVFESAAQDQGLRDIRFVGHPEQRDLLIQRVIQAAGVRAVATNITGQDAYSGDGI